MTVKNGSAIDPKSGLSDKAHVYSRDGVLYNKVLNHVDIVKNKNSFHKLQVLQSDDFRQYWLFQSWGRTGTIIGDHKLDPYNTAELAVTEFEDVFRSKTGNRFDSTTEFVKKSGFFYPIDIDYNEDTEEISRFSLEVNSSIPSKLAPATQNLMKMIFDVDNMTRTMMEFELDLVQMPLGKLSDNQLQHAQQTLSELNELIVKGADDAEFVGLSAKFFTLVPHNLGMRQAPIINTLELIRDKQRMVESLFDMKIAYSLLQNDVDENSNPIDVCYGKLRTQLEPLDRESEEFKLIETYLENTQIPGHRDYTAVIEDVFIVKRDGEEERYRSFKSLYNRQLLWHGSRTINFASILKNGLKIAPPEAPVTGYMFGKGISNEIHYCVLDNLIFTLFFNFFQAFILLIPH